MKNTMTVGTKLVGKKAYGVVARKLATVVAVNGDVVTVEYEFGGRSVYPAWVCAAMHDIDRDAANGAQEVA